MVDLILTELVSYTALNREKSIQVGVRSTASLIRLDVYDFSKKVNSNRVHFSVSIWFERMINYRNSY